MSPTPASYRILLVDDRPESLAALRAQLELRGHRVDSVEGVLYAMWAVNASHRVYDLVISAIELSDGDGVELLTRLRERMGVRTIGLTVRGADTGSYRRAAAAEAIDLVLPHPAGARPNEPVCEALCDAASRLMRPVQPSIAPPPPPAPPGSAVQPPHVA